MKPHPPCSVHAARANLLRRKADVAFTKTIKYRDMTAYRAVRDAAPCALLCIRRIRSIPSVAGRGLRLPLRRDAFASLPRSGAFGRQFSPPRDHQIQCTTCQTGTAVGGQLGKDRLTAQGFGQACNQNDRGVHGLGKQLSQPRATLLRRPRNCCAGTASGTRITRVFRKPDSADKLSPRIVGRQGAASAIAGPNNSLLARPQDSPRCAWARSAGAAALRPDLNPS